MMKSADIPAGLVDNNVEFFVHDDQLLATYSGAVHKYFDLPDDIRTVFQVEMIRDKIAQEFLTKVFGLVDGLDMELQFVKCRFGGFDNHPDLMNGRTRSECWDCGRHGSCQGEGRICLLPAGSRGSLSKREYQTAVMVGKGYKDARIADELSISKGTVREYMKRIRAKIIAKNRQEIADFAHKNSLL